jgi:hypothetical protein
MKTGYYESIQKIQTSNWITSLLLIVTTMRALNQLRPAVKPAGPEANEIKSCSAAMCFLLTPHLVSHLQLVMAPLEQCT